VQVAAVRRAGVRGPRDALSTLNPVAGGYEDASGVADHDVDVVAEVAQPERVPPVRRPQRPGDLGCTTRPAMPASSRLPQRIAMSSPW